MFDCLLGHSFLCLEHHWYSPEADQQQPEIRYRQNVIALLGKVHKLKCLIILTY